MSSTSACAKLLLLASDGTGLASPPPAKADSVMMETAASSNVQMKVAFCCFVACVIVILSLWNLVRLVCLVIKLECELNFPGISRLVGEPKRRGLQISSGLVENKVGMVEKVEKLCAKLQLGFFGQSEILQH